jgi:hypothetical protein
MSRVGKNSTPYRSIILLILLVPCIGLALLRVYFVAGAESRARP